MTDYVKFEGNHGQHDLTPGKSYPVIEFFGGKRKSLAIINDDAGSNIEVSLSLPCVHLKRKAKWVRV